MFEHIKCNKKDNRLFYNKSYGQGNDDEEKYLIINKFKEIDYDKDLIEFINSTFYAESFLNDIYETIQAL